MQGWQVIEGADRTVGALSHHHPDAVGIQSPRDECEHIDRFLVEPLQVVDHDQGRPGARDRAEQGVRSEADQEHVGRRAENDPDRHPKGLALHRRQLVDEGLVAQHQSLHTGEGQAGLGLRADKSFGGHIRVRFGDVVQQGRFPDAWVTADDQDPAGAGAHRGDQLLESRAFTGAADECAGRILGVSCDRVGPLAASVVGDSSP